LEIITTNYRDRWLNELKKKFLLFNALERISRNLNQKPLSSKREIKIRRICVKALHRYSKIIFKKFPVYVDYSKSQTKVVRDLVSKPVGKIKKHRKASKLVRKKTPTGKSASSIAWNSLHTRGF